MQKCKNEKHASLVKSHTVKRMFWKMQNFSLGGSLTILQSENVFFQRSENATWTQFFFKQRHLTIRELTQWYQLTHAIIPWCGEALESLWTGFFAEKRRYFKETIKIAQTLLSTRFFTIFVYREPKFESERSLEPLAYQWGWYGVKEKKKWSSILEKDVKTKL